MIIVFENLKLVCGFSILTPEQGRVFTFFKGGHVIQDYKSGEPRLQECWEPLV